jgi:hypothetical protein
MSFLIEIVSTPIGLAGAVVMGLLAVETTAIAWSAERHRQAVLRYRKAVETGLCNTTQDEQARINSEAARYMNRNLLRVRDALELAEEINPKAGMVFTLISFGAMLPDLWDVLLIAPSSAFADIGTAIWTSFFGISTSMIATVQNRRLSTEITQLGISLEESPVNSDEVFR